jgi:SAM-dependent methyltransferase
MDPEIAQGMMSPDRPPDASAGIAGFDRYAADYDATLNRGLRISGESKEYFASGRLRHLRARFDSLNFAPEHVLDFGCGTGTATPLFFDLLQVRSVRGLDPSADSLDIARNRWAGHEATFATSAEGWEGRCDLAFCNGVFHHIPPGERAAALAVVRNTLKPGGLFAFWENNPWNPLTRLAMRLVPFDADAVLLWPHGARRLLRENGFEVLGTDYVFFFPRFLTPLRRLEPRLAWLPLGGQYLILCRRDG